MSSFQNNRTCAAGNLLVLLAFLALVFNSGCSTNKPTTKDNDMVVDDKQLARVPVSTVQQPSNELSIDLLDIGEHPELEPSLEFPNTPLYVLDDEDPESFQGGTNLDKVGVKKSVFDSFPFLYEPLGTLKSATYAADRIAFIQNSGYTIRCHPVHWDLAVPDAQERQTDYLVSANVFVSEYCDENPTDGCLEQWSFPKNALNAPVLVNRTVFPN
jgi:hypothetical protein